MGRLWQTLYLSQWQQMFAYLPVETVIKDQQTQYYQALSSSDKAGDSTTFVLFMLKALLSSINEIQNSSTDQVKRLLNWLNNKEPQKLSVIMEGLALKHRPTFNNNYLSPALNANYIAMASPDSPKSPTQKYFLTQFGKDAING